MANAAGAPAVAALLDGVLGLRPASQDRVLLGQRMAELWSQSLDYGALGKWLSAEGRPTGLGPRYALGTSSSIAAAITVGGGLV